MRSVEWLLVFALAFLLSVGAAVVPATAEETAGPEVDSDDLAADGLTDTNATPGNLSVAEEAVPGEADIDPGGESRITLGDEETVVVIDVYHGLVSNLPQGGAIGVEIEGWIGEEPVVALRTSVVFEGADSWQALPSNLTDRFGTSGFFHLDLPFTDALALDDDDIGVDIDDVQDGVDGLEEIDDRNESDALDREENESMGSDDTPTTDE